MAKAYAPFVRKIEVETETLEQVREAVEAGADIIMLDNMSHEQMAEAVKLIDGRAATECSGNVTKENIAQGDRNWCGLCIQRCPHSFCAYYGYFNEKLTCHLKRRKGAI